VRVSLEGAEEARARLLELCPEGFEELEEGGGLELAAYVDPAVEERLRVAFGRVAASDVAPGWEGAWRAFHRPVRVGPLWVGPPWEEPDAGAIAVVIDPGQAFGTGAHATTRLCLELLLEQERTSVADLGCGSGVLGIAAAKLGFAPVIALDDDDAAVAAACANAKANGVELGVRRGDVLAGPLPAAELALVNLERGLVERVLVRSPARRAIASGYLAGERVSPDGWVRRAGRERDGWVAELFERVARPS